MRRPLARLGLTLGALLAAPPAPGAEQDTAILPSVSLRFLAARYAPVETDLHWTGWVGGSADLVRLDRWSFGGSAEVETVLGDTLRPFEATQSNYHLAVFLRRPLGGGEAELFFHHVSRHFVDRFKVDAVDWNVLGLRAALPLSKALPVPGRLVVSAGRTTLASLVDYEWLFTARVESDLVSRPWGIVYLDADARLVATEDSELFDRSGFFDLGLEAGLHLGRPQRGIALFAAFERRNDVFVMQPGRRERALIGLRIGFARPSARPEPPPTP